MVRQLEGFATQIQDGDLFAAVRSKCELNGLQHCRVQLRHYSFEVALLISEIVLLIRLAELNKHRQARDNCDFVP